MTQTGVRAGFHPRRRPIAGAVKFAAKKRTTTGDSLGRVGLVRVETGRRPLGIILWTLPVIVCPVPIHAPFPHVAGHVVQSIAVGGKLSDRGRHAEAVLGGVLIRKAALPKVGDAFFVRLEFLTPDVFFSVETTPGGKALKFYSSVRIDIRRREQLKDNTGNVVGNHVRAKVVKNKVSPPFTEAEFDIMYGQGINWEGDLIAVGLARGVIQKKGAWLQYDGEMIGQGKEASRRALEENKELAARIHSEITEGKPEFDDEADTPTAEETAEPPAEE